jgi:SAM-dependent methyltransferase
MEDGLAAMEQSASYDLVFWDNALHHMPDTIRAIAASRSCLRSGGLFVMNDFIGPDRFQWTDRQLYYATSVRSKLSKRLLRHPTFPDRSLRPCAVRPSIEGMIAADPSEAADSGRILERVRTLLPNPSIWMLGGCIYFIALNDVLANVDLEHDSELLESLLILDLALSELGENLYAACISVRP